MRSGRASFLGNLAANPILTGSIMLLAGLIGVIVSYNANKGLPFVPTYVIHVRVPDAAELIRGGSEVRVGGARVGLVKKVEAERGGGNNPPFAQLTLGLDKKLESIPVDSTVQVRPRSILGAKFVDLTIGKSRTKLPPGGTLPLKNAIPVVDLDEAFGIFGGKTGKGIQDSVSAFGDALAGRGEALNELVGSAGRSFPAFERVLRNLVDPRTDLSGFIGGAAAASGAIAPVAAQLGSLFDHGATTLAAVDAAGPALGQTIDELPPTEITGARSLDRIGPVLADAAAIARAIRPGTKVLPQASRRLAVALHATTPVLRKVPGFADRLKATLAAVDRLGRDKQFNTDLVDGVPTLTHLGSVLGALGAAQTQCNFMGTWFRNVPSVIGRGNADFPWFNILLVIQSAEMLQSAKPAPNLHANFAPKETASECEAGNEGYQPGQLIGNPAGTQPNHTVATAPPPGVLDRARAAGLLTPVRGAK